MYRKIPFVCLCLLLLLLCKTISYAQSGRLFNQSNALFAAGNYSGALKGYQQLENGGNKTANLFNNMGNIYYRTNQWAKAELYFEKAIRLSPLDTQLVYSRDKTLAKLGKTIMANNTGFTDDNFAFTKNVEIANKIALVVLLISGLFFLVYSFVAKSKDKTVAAVFCKVIMGLSLLTLLITGLLYANHQSATYALVTGVGSELYLGPAKTSKIAGNLDEGYLVKIINEYPGWYEVTTYNNKTGWLKVNNLSKIE